MNVFLDTNVVLDVFAHRDPFYDASAKVWALAERGKIVAFVSAVSMTTLYYVVRKRASHAAASEMLQAVRSCVVFAPCDAAVINQAIDAGFEDFEDAVQYFSAQAAEAEAIVTRNADHFPVGDLAIMTPAAFLAAHVFQ